MSGDYSHADTMTLLQDISEPVLENSPEVLTIDEAAKFLSISSRTLERYIRESSIPFARLPKRGARVSVRFLRSQLIKWLQQRTVRPDRWKMSGL